MQKAEKKIQDFIPQYWDGPLGAHTIWTIKNP